MLYKKKNEILSKELFANPTSEYRGTPFWSWNTKLEKSLLLEEIEQMKLMGMGGFHMHCRTGLDTEYMGEEFMELVRACHEKAKEENMLTWLYDEDRWPSGYGGGLVTKEEKNRIRYLIFSPTPKEVKTPYAYETRVAATSHGEGTLLAKYRIHLKDGCLHSYEKIGLEEETKENENIWYAYLEIGPDNPWYNNQAYVNTLDKNAIETFISCTHEKYKEILGEDFGKTIPAIFSDEPQMAYKCFLDFAEEKKDIMMPFSERIPEEFSEKYGFDLMQNLPELFWESENKKISKTRFYFHDYLGEKFTSATFDTLGSWCEKNGIMFTGHLMNESSLHLQTISMGDAMRCYRSFGLPGVDMLCDRREFNTVKQAESVTHQFGKEGVLSEEYGVTNWDFDFRNHKLQGDWQAALGVTVRVHHLNHVSLKGEAKRDYPASIGYQSPWYQKYSYIENHFSRLNTALTRGKAVVRVGVIHPVESYWLHFGPNDQTSDIRKQMDENFENLTDWLLSGLIDFDFISESLLPAQYELSHDGKLHIGEMAYDTVIVQGCETMRKTTLNSLINFKSDGGNLVFVGELPSYVDAEPSKYVQILAEQSICVSMEKKAILESIDKSRSIDIKVVENTGENTIKHEKNPFADKGERTNHLIYQLREDKENKWLFICNAYPVKNADIPCSLKVRIEIDGCYEVDHYDTITGLVNENIPVELSDGKTKMDTKLEYHDSILLHLKNPTNSVVKLSDCNEKEVKNCVQEIEFLEPVKVSLSEPNVVLLDQAEYRFDEEIWQKKEELLRIDDSIREKLGLPLRMADVAQPWTDSIELEKKHILSLRFQIHSDVRILDGELALEEREHARVFWNGKEVSTKSTGYFIDKSIEKIQLGTIEPGENEIIIDFEYTSKTNIEYCFLLGDFGVKLQGREARITPKVEHLGFGDWTTQGLPFYAGNVTYHLNAKGKKGDWKLKAPFYRAPLITVAFDNEGEKEIPFAPCEYSIKKEEGIHEILLTAYGSRVNTLGAVHNTDMQATYFGPDAWRSQNDRWTYGYMLHPAGIMISPILKIYQ